MAFIYRADKDPNIFRISSSVVGPGEYLDILPQSFRNLYKYD